MPGPGLKWRHEFGLHRFGARQYSDSLCDGWNLFLHTHRFRQDCARRPSGSQRVNAPRVSSDPKFNHHHHSLGQQRRRHDQLLMNIPDARQANDQSAAGDTHAAFIKIVIDAIDSSVGNKTNSAVISFNGKQGSDIMNTLGELKRKGYRVSQSGTNWTISW